MPLHWPVGLENQLIGREGGLKFVATAFRLVQGKQ